MDHFIRAAILCCIWMACAQAQESSLRSPARSDLVQDWVELKLPKDISSRFKLQPTVHYDCEFLRFREDGQIDRVSLTFGAPGETCPTDAATIRKALDSVPKGGTGATQFDHQTHSNGHTFLSLRGRDQPNGSATWLALQVAKQEVAWETVQLRKGDLLLFLFVQGQNDPTKPIYVLRWLRPLNAL